MNNNAEQYDHIESFLLGKLSPEAKSDFEIAMRRDAALAEAVELRRLEFDVAEALIANDIRTQMSRLRDGYPSDDGTKKTKKSGTKTISRKYNSGNWVATHNKNYKKQ